MDLAVIGPKGKDYQVQRLVALKGNGKRLDPTASRFQGVVPDRGASAHPFFNHIIFRA